jgi:putative peptide zinc metalloprotease protein
MFITKLLKRYKKRREREIRSKLLSIMFIRIPLFDPEIFLKHINKLIKIIFSYAGAIIWFLVFIAGIKVVIDNFDAAIDQAQGILAPDNLFLLYIGLVFIKTIHEFGHTLMCKRFGGEVHTMGVMLLIFTPLPYMDATSSWSFRNRWHRILVSSAGMITELFVASIAAFVWAKTGNGVLHSIAYNIMFIASVSAVLFNANPLLRFDGYYILSDLLDIPNLSGRAFQHLKHIIERHIFGIKQSKSPALSLKEASWLTVFGIISGIYKVFVFTAILLFVGDKFLLVGMIMACICIVSWGIVPAVRFINYLASSPKLLHTRIRAIMASVSAFLVIVGFLAVCPFPNRFRAPGIMEAKEHIQVINDVSGYVEEFVVNSSKWVEKGTPLIILSNRDLDFEIEVSSAQKKETLALETRAMRVAAEDIEPIRKRLQSIEAKLTELFNKKASLIIKAKNSGKWVSPNEKDMLGTWVQRGTSVGKIINNTNFRFSAVVDQDEAANLFINQIRKAEVRIYGQSGINIDVKSYEIIPFQHERLPSAALGWRGGGEVPVSLTDESGLKTAEPFFQIYADLAPLSQAAMFHGISGKLRFSMHPKPLLFQWAMKLRRLIQKRYRI